MSSTALALRSSRPKRLVSPKLLKYNDKLSITEWFRVYPNALVGILSVALLTFSIVTVATTTTDTLGVFGIIFGTLGIIWGIAWTVMEDGGEAQKFYERKEWVLGERYYQTRPHADVEQTRLPELDNKYKRYSVGVSREGKSISMKIWEHDPDNGTWFLIPHKSETGRHGFRDGTWGQQIIGNRDLQNPSVDELQAAYQTMQQAAESLEENSYNEALEEYKLEAKVLAIRSPDPNANEYVKNLVERDNEE